MRVGNNDLFAAGTGIVVGAKVKIRCGSTLMDISGEFIGAARRMRSRLQTISLRRHEASDGDARQCVAKHPRLVGHKQTCNLGCAAPKPETFARPKTK